MRDGNEVVMVVGGGGWWWVKFKVLDQKVSRTKRIVMEHVIVF